MATFPQPLTDVQTLPPSSCPRCCRRQAQNAGPSPRERVQAHPSAISSGQYDLSSTQPDDMIYSPRGKER